MNTSPKSHDEQSVVCHNKNSGFYDYPVDPDKQLLSSPSRGYQRGIRGAKTHKRAGHLGLAFEDRLSVVEETFPQKGKGG